MMYSGVVSPREKFGGQEKTFLFIPSRIWRKLSLFSNFSIFPNRPKKSFFANIVELWILNIMQKKLASDLVEFKSYGRNGTSKWYFSGGF